MMCYLVGRLAAHGYRIYEPSQLQNNANKRKLALADVIQIKLNMGEMLFRELQLRNKMVINK